MPNREAPAERAPTPHLEVPTRPEPQRSAEGNGHGPAPRSDASGAPGGAATDEQAPEPGPKRSDEAERESEGDATADPAPAATASSDEQRPSEAGEAVASRPRPRPAPAPSPPEPVTASADAPEGSEGRVDDGAPSGDAVTVELATGAAAANPDGVVPAPAQPAGDTWFAPRPAETTQVIPRIPGPPAGLGQSTQVIPSPGPSAPPRSDDPDDPAAADPAAPPRWRRPLLVLAAVVAALALLYAGDLIVSSGAVPRGVTVAGVPVGGLSFADAERRLRTEIEPRSTRAVALTVGEVRSELDPRAAGLEVDWQATLARVGSQPLNPVTRIASFFVAREVGVVTSADEQALTAALEQLAPVVDRAPVEGSVRFDGVTPVPVDPVAGQRLDVPGAADVLREQWASGRPVALPLVELAPTTSRDDVAAAIEEVARPAVSAPVTVLGEGVQATLTPEVIATVLSFRADPGSGLVPEINQQAVIAALDPQLASSERPGRDASLDFSGGTPVVVPSQDGRGVDYDATLADLLSVLTGTGPRQLTAVYAEQPAELTTAELDGLGITGLISEFTTGGFASDSGLNIKRAAEQINGTIVEPGETFSLNGATSPRDAANGYVEAGIISDGHPSRGVGGGVSQVATTLYNAAYFAGMVDVTHQEHSFYISRYPPGREATVFEGSIDLKFRNDNPTGVLIETVWTPESITVRMFGTKRYEVTSTPGPRTNPTSPNTVTIPAGEPCSPSRGAPGFTITDTRTLREISTGQVRTETQTVRYNPSPIVICGG